MLSFWEKEQLLHAQYIIAGSGITGLSTAISIKEKQPNADVIVLERGLLPTGASTKNAGFACIGSLTEKQYDITLMGEENLVQLVANRWEGLKMLRQRLGDATIDFQNNGGYELITHERKVELDEIEAMNKLLFSIFNKPIFSQSNQRINQFGFKGVEQLIVNEVEGQINTGMMMKNLLLLANQKGVRVITGASIQSYHLANDKVQIELEGSVINFTANKFIICTNAFTGKLLPDEEINPGRGQVLITNPIDYLKVKGIFNFDEGFYYFRNYGNRILFGGGRNLDFEGEATTDIALNETIQNKLEYYLREMIIPGIEFNISDRWAGIMAFGANKLPLVKKIDDQIIVGARLNGMGVALGSKVGDQLCKLATE